MSSTRPIHEDLVIQACLEVYAAVRHQKKLADRALDSNLRAKKNLYAQERRIIAERVYGLLRHERLIDALLGQSGPTFSKLPEGHQDLARFLLSRIVHGESTAEVLKRTRPPGEIRTLIEAIEGVPLNLGAVDEAKKLAIRSSIPDFLAEKFLTQYGPQAQALAEIMNARAPLTIRCNTLKIGRDELKLRLRSEGVESKVTPRSEFGLFLETRLNAFALPSFKEGLFEIQDEGSQLLGALVDAPPTRVADACAGAGGKTLQLAAQMKNRGELFALDIEDYRMDELRRRARRAGVHNVRTHLLPVVPEEADAFVRTLGATMDRVLVDAPCSGTGTFRRKPDARYRLKPEDIPMFTEKQKSLLHRFSALVKPKGRLVYGTCSLLREENQDVVSWFLDNHPAFKLRGSFLQLTPLQHGTDGFFGAVFDKT